MHGFVGGMSQILAQVVWVTWVHKVLTWINKNSRVGIFVLMKHDFMNFCYEVLLMILVSSLHSLHIRYCVVPLKSYCITAMKRHYFQKSKD